jgi:hypothetical protein
VSDTVQPPILRHFSYEHLRPDLQRVSRPIGELAREMARVLGSAAYATSAATSEYHAGFRKLLEAKDCFVRVQVDAPAEKTPASGQHRQPSGVISACAQAGYEVMRAFARGRGDYSMQAWEASSQEQRVVLEGLAEEVINGAGSKSEEPKTMLFKSTVRDVARALGVSVRVTRGGE